MRFFNPQDSKAANSLLAKVDFQGHIRTIMELAQIIFGWASLHQEVIWYKDFGERQITIIRCFFAYSFLGLYRLFGAGIGGLLFGSKAASSRLFSLFVVVFVGLSIYHLVGVYRRRHKQWFSLSTGLSRLSFLPLSETVLFLIVEPFCAFFLAYLIGIIDSLLGSFLTFSATAFLIRNALTFQTFRDKWLSIRDAQIESEMLQAALLDGRPPEESYGYRPIGMNFKKLSTDERAAVVATIASSATPDEADVRDIGDTVASIMTRDS